MTILPNPDVLPPPKIGEEVEIELSTGTVTGKIAGWRVQGAGLWMLTLSLPGGGTELLTAERASDGGWYVHDCRSIGRGIAAARRVKAGKTDHGSVNQALQELADTVLALAGIPLSAS